MRPPSVAAGSGGRRLLIAAAVVFGVAFGSVLVGARDLIAGDVLYCCPPWSGQAGAHAAQNSLLADPPTQFLPWLQLTRDAYAHGRLPLWDAHAVFGKPLLANDQSAPFSPFTLVAAAFGGARGLSLADLLKIWVAGLGTALFVRRLGVGGIGAGIAGIAYASSSFMVLWLGWPHTAVAALMPWAFLAVEALARQGDRRWAALLAAVVALQFLAGHVETSIHMALGLGVYAAVRCAALGGGRALRALGWLAAGAALGTAAAAAQLLPFLDVLRTSSLLGDRAAVATGAAHLRESSVTSWFVPNLYGNPALDGLVGRFPNYNEATGYAGVAVLLLAGLAVARWRPGQGAGVPALAAAGLAAAGIAYGPLSPVAGLIPVLNVSNNGRAVVVVCFVVAALGGVGAERALSFQPRPGRRWLGPAVAAGAALAGLLVITAGVLHGSTRHAEAIAGQWHGRQLLWVAASALAALAVAGLVAASALGGRRLAAAGLPALVLTEAVLFAVPFNPRVVPAEEPPASPVAAWLAGHAGDRPFVATGGAFFPEAPTLYGLYDGRGVDTVLSGRVRTFWRAADPGFDDAALATVLHRPDARWLAAAGVAYVVSTDEPVPGTREVLAADGVRVAEVPEPRPFAHLAPGARAVAGPAEAADALAGDPLGPAAVEAGCCVAGGTGTAEVRSRTPERVEVAVDAGAPATLVVLQAWSSGWRAEVDGRAVPVRPADVLFQSVAVPAGRHRVVLTYDPPAVRAGLLVSALAALAIAALALVRR